METFKLISKLIINLIIIVFSILLIVKGFKTFKEVDETSKYIKNCTDSLILENKKLKEDKWIKVNTIFCSDTVVYLKGKQYKYYKVVFTLKD